MEFIISGMVLIFCWFLFQWLFRVVFILLIAKAAGGAVNEIKKKGENTKNDEGKAVG